MHEPAISVKLIVTVFKQGLTLLGGKGCGGGEGDGGVEGKGGYVGSQASRQDQLAERFRRKDA